MQEHELSTELQRTTPVHLLSLGKLAGREQADPSTDLSCVITEGGLTRKISGVYLGKLLGADGWNAGYKDDDVTPVPETGIAFGVSQASYGYTGIFAKPMTGYRVESAVLDSVSQRLSWTDSVNHDGKVTVTGDWGNMQSEDPSKILSNPIADLANPGARIGLIRVTSPDNSVKTYALAADFQGEPDDWRVHGGIIEVNLNSQSSIDRVQSPKSLNE